MVMNVGTIMYMTAAPPGTPYAEPDLVAAYDAATGELISPDATAAEMMGAGGSWALGPFCSTNHSVYTVDPSMPAPVKVIVSVPLDCDHTP